MGLDHNENNNYHANRSIGSSTPVAPKLTLGRTQIITKQDILDKASKTPYLASTQNPNFHRGFKSEFQQKNSSRIAQSVNNNIERHYPSTSLRNQNIINRFNPQSAKKNTNNKNSVVLSRLNNIFNKTPKIHQPFNQQTHKTPILTHKSHIVTQTKTPILNHKTPLLNHKTPLLNHKSPLLSHKTPVLNHKTPILSNQISLLNHKTPLLSNQNSLLNHKTPVNIIPQKTPGLNHKTPITTLHKTPYQTKTSQQPQATQTNVEQKTNNPIPPTATKTIHSTSSVNSSARYNILVNDKTYKVLRKLGAGGSAKVYEALEPKTMNPVAIKIIGLARADERTRQSYFNELSILSKLRDNRHVVHMFDSEHKVNLDELVIVMEKGDADLSKVIDDHFKTRGNTYLDGIFIKYYWLGMVKAVNEIHKHGIVHADLKPVNFIIIRNEIKLIDFGIADAVEPESTSIIKDYQIGTINYMAPESLRNRALDASFIAQNPNDGDNQYKKTVIKYNCKADIWSLGCILYNLVYGRPPFDKFKDFPSKMQAIIDPRYQIHFPLLSHQKLSECMKLCLQYDVKHRPTAEELLRHPYLSEDLIAIL